MNNIVEELLKIINKIFINNEEIVAEDLKKYKHYLLLLIEDVEALRFFKEKILGEGLYSSVSSAIMADLEIIIENRSNLNELPRTTEGSVNLDRDVFAQRKHYGAGQFAKKWILLETEYLIKDLKKDNNPIITLIAEEIARQLDLDVAKYYPAILER